MALTLKSWWSCFQLLFNLLFPPTPSSCSPSHTWDSAVREGGTQLWSGEDHFITRCMYLKCHYSQRAQRRRKIRREKCMTLESPSTSLCSDVGEGGCLLCNHHQLQWCWDDLTSRTVLYFSEHSAIFYVACLKECLKQVSTCEGYNTGHTKAKSLEERTETNVFAQELAWELRFPWPPTSTLPWSSAFL